MIFAIADLHGRADLLQNAVYKLETTYTSGTVVFLGDYVDRGPDSKGVLDILMRGPRMPDKWTWIIIRGNHEDMMLECHQQSSSQHSWWISHGGDATLKSFGGSIPIKYLEWVDELPRLYWDDHHVFTHAGVLESHPLDDQPNGITQWYRYPSLANVGWNGKHVVHGHTKRKVPELYENRTNLDGGAYSNGILYVGVFEEDKATGPIKVLEVTA